MYVKSPLSEFAECREAAFEKPRSEGLTNRINGFIEYGYLKGCWENGTHRKWCVILDRQQFDEFVEHRCLSTESTETMGSLGAPGFGWVPPAIRFISHDSDAMQGAYVTPIPEAKREACGDRDWDRFRGRCCRFMADRYVDVSPGTDAVRDTHLRHVLTLHHEARRNGAKKRRQVQY